MSYNEISSYKPLLECIDDKLDLGRSWEHLYTTDMEELAGHVIKALGKEAYLCIAESDDCDVIMHQIAKHMISGDNSFDICEILTKAAVKYFWKDIEEVFMERQNLLEYGEKWDAGLRPRIDNQNGEVTWSRA